MHYRILGQTGIKVSILGYGAMRLPTITPGEPKINENEAIRLIRMAIDNGVNFVDTAYNYHNNESEIVVGKALKNGYRNKVTLSTKAPIWKDEYNKREHFQEHLHEQLKKLDVESIDIYLLHAINEKTWKKVQELNLIEEGRKAKEQGKIKHLAFSFHDKPEVLKEIIDSNGFEVMLVQYNILDTVLEEMIEYAHKKGLGVMIMGPVAGGRLAGAAPEEMKEYLSPGKNTFADLALKFVWSNPNVNVALSGMGSEEMVSTNLAVANSENYTLTSEQMEKAKELGKKIKGLSELICTSCKYCEPCKQEVNISYIFRCLIAYQVYGQRKDAKRAYSQIGTVDWAPGKNAEACIECGECLDKCPQKIQIIDQLKEAHKILTAE
ncbi:MAG: aldo/keto reductase [Candidatus Thorarchaeota archaeon]